MNYVCEICNAIYGNEYAYKVCEEACREKQFYKKSPFVQGIYDCSTCANEENRDCPKYPLGYDLKGFVDSCFSDEEKILKIEKLKCATWAAEHIWFYKLKAEEQLKIPPELKPIC